MRRASKAADRDVSRPLTSPSARCGRALLCGAKDPRLQPLAQPATSGLRIKINSALRRECLDRLLFWTAIDLETKLIAFKDYYNGHRSHSGLKGKTPIETFESKGASLRSYRWRQHCRGLYQTPMAA